MSDLVERLRALQKGERVFSMSYKSACKEAADEITRLDGLREQSEFVIDVLESNARVQAKLLADTGRERDELRRQLTTAYDALKPFASVVEVAPLGDGKIDRVMIEVSIKDLRAAMHALLYG